MFTGEKKKVYQKLYMRKVREKKRSNNPVKTEAFEAKTPAENSGSSERKPNPDFVPRTDVCEPLILNVPKMDADGNPIYEE